MTTDGDVAVVGGGIVGTITAFMLQRAGFSVILLSEDQPGAGTAGGSAGYLHDGEIFPLANFALLAQLPQLLFDPLGPLVFRLSYLPQLREWGMHFLSSMRKSRVETAIQALGSLNRAAIDSICLVADATNVSDLLVYRGGLKIIRDKRNLEAIAGELQHLDKVGIPAQLLDSAAVLRLAPEVAPDLAGGVFFPQSAHCIDPAMLGARIAERVSLDGTVIRGRATALSSQGDEGWTISFTDQQRSAHIHVKRVVVTAGYGSAVLLRRLGYKVPLASARGYHLMISEPGISMTRPIIFHEPHIGATPMSSGLRLAGSMEFAPPSAPPDYRRADMLFKIASRYLPGLQNRKATTWMGVRPLTPDSLPAIGMAWKHRNLYYCFGHGHLGLTQAAVSARCITELLSDVDPIINLEPFNLNRFN